MPTVAPENQPHIRDGFPGQRMLVLPRPLVRQALTQGAVRDLLPTDIGYFPDAAWHYVEREEGISQLIIIYCLRGVGWGKSNDDSREIKAGDVLLLPPGTPHAYGSGGKHPWSICWMHLAGGKVDSLVRLLVGERPLGIVHMGEDSEAMAAFEEAYDCLRRDYGPDNLLLASFSVGTFLNRLISHRRSSSDEDSPRQRIERTIEFMKRRRDKRVTVPELARLASLSCSHYSSLFKKHVGFPPLDYFLRLKMQRACELLDTTPLSIKRIAGELGFNDPLYFSRLFHQIHELSPIQYRQQKKG